MPHMPEDRPLGQNKLKTDTTVKKASKKASVHHLQESDACSESSINKVLHSVFQLGGSGGKISSFCVYQCDIEVGSSVECTTIL